MPASFDHHSVGFQLWINLEAKNKFCDPNYQEIKKN
jgi:redox-sensitive bicupin YhaK (pirin superfamily)